MQILHIDNLARSSANRQMLIDACQHDNKITYIFDYQTLHLELQNKFHDLVFIFDNLDWSDSFEVLHQLNIYRPDIPVIMIGEVASPKKMVRGMREGLSDYLIHPDSNEIRQAIQSTISENGLANPYRLMFEESPLAIFSVRPDGRIRMVNRKACELTGFNEHELLNKKVLELYADTADGASRAKAILKQFQAGKPVRQHELQMKKADGQTLWISLSVHVVKNSSGKVLYSNSVAQDITQVKSTHESMLNSNRMYAFISEVNAAILRATDRIDLLDKICHAAVETGGFRMAWVGTKDLVNKQIIPVASAGIIDGYLDNIQISTDATVLGSGPTGRALRQSATVTCNDIKHDPAMAPWREEALARGYHSSIALPVIVSDEIFGTLNLYASTPHFFDRGEIELLEQITSNLSSTLEQMLRNEQLEATRMVLDRTRDKLDLAISNSGIGLWDWKVQTGETSFNEIWAEMLGYSLAELGPLSIKTWEKLTHPDDFKIAGQKLEEHFKQNTPLYECELRMRHVDGHWVWILDRGRVVSRDESGNPLRMIGTHVNITESKKQETDLRQSQQKFAQAFHSSPQAMLITTLKRGDILDANESFFRIFGYNPDEVFNHSTVEIGIWVNKTARNKMVRAVKESGQVQNYELQLFNKKRQSLFILFSAGMLDLDGENCLLSSMSDITVRKNIEQALQRSENLFRESLEKIRMMAIQLDLQGRVTFCNQYLSDITGYRHDELIGIDWFATFVPAIRPDVKEKFLQAMADGEIASLFENPIILRDGSERLIRFSNTVLHDRDGNVIGSNSLGEDITEQRQAELALRDSEQRLRAAMQNIPDVVVIYDRDLRIRYIIEATRLITGRSIADFLGRRDDEIWPKHTYSHYLPLLEKCLSDGVPQTVVAQVDVGGEKPKYLHIQTIPLTDQNGTVHEIMGITRDLTAQKEFEQRIRSRNQELESLNKIIRSGNESQNVDEVLKLVLNEAVNFSKIENGFICLTDPEGKFHINTHASGITLPAACCESICATLKATDEPLVLESSRKIEKAINLPKCKIQFLVAFSMRSRDENIGILCLFSEKKHRLDSNKRSVLTTMAQQMALVIENTRLFEETINYAQHLEQRVAIRTHELNLKSNDLELANARLQEADRLKSIFLASMSHELRTPLNSIIGFTGIMLMGPAGALNPEQHRQLTIVRNSANHLLSLINDLLDVSKIEAGRMDVTPESFELKDFLDEILELFRPQAQEKNLTLTSYINELTVLFTDKRRLRQIVINLLSNAIKYTDNGHIELITSPRADGILAITVRDTGIGIREDQLSRLFFPFQQIDESLTKTQPGTGLGLYLCKKLALLLGGDISVQSNFGHGSIFTLLVPVEYKGELE
jgi:PAS domain S-box-containing protein